MGWFYCKVCGVEFEKVEDVLEHLVKIHNVDSYNFEIWDMIGFYAEFEDYLEECLTKNDVISFGCEGLRVNKIGYDIVIIEVYDGSFDIAKLLELGIKEFNLIGGRILLTLNIDKVLELLNNCKMDEE